MKKKWWSAALTAALTIGVAAGTAQAVKADDEITIRMLTRFSESTTQGGIILEKIEEFEEAHPGVKVICEMQPDETSYNNILNADIASGTMPNIFRVQGNSNLKEYVEEGILLDLEPYLEADPEWGDGFNQGVLNSMTVPGVDGIYGVPAEAGIVSFYYNEELLEKAGISEFPKTWTELLEAVAKLKEIDVIPIAIGTQSPYMAGHLHNNIFYKWVGCEGTKKLGMREMKWTDEEVVQTLQYIQDLIDAGAFDPGAAGYTDDVAFTQFQQGEAAMIITGSWKNGIFGDPEKTPIADSVRLAEFPYFEEKPELAGNAMSGKAPYNVNGKLEGEELELTIELLKAVTGAEITKRYAEEAAYSLPRTDVELDETKCSYLFMRTAELTGAIEEMATDVFDFDPLSSMMDRSRNSIASLFVGSMTPEEAAAEIQAEIDNAN